MPREKIIFGKVLKKIQGKEDKKLPSILSFIAEFFKKFKESYKKKHRVKDVLTDLLQFLIGIATIVVGILSIVFSPIIGIKGVLIANYEGDNQVLGYFKGVGRSIKYGFYYITIGLIELVLSPVSLVIKAPVRAIITAISKNEPELDDKVSEEKIIVTGTAHKIIRRLADKGLESVIRPIHFGALNTDERQYAQSIARQIHSHFNNSDQKEQELYKNITDNSLPKKEDFENYFNFAKNIASNNG